MYVARILYPVEVLGPGKRIGIWFCGCPHRCKGCSNPELWELQERYYTTPERMFHLIQHLAKEHPIDGFTITGGDPMFQAKDLIQLIKLLHTITDDILVYTGYRMEELSQQQLMRISVLIDGKYIESRNTNCLLRGSDNQKIYILNKQLEPKYRAYFDKASNQIQNFTTIDGTVSVGIHFNDFSF